MVKGHLLVVNTFVIKPSLGKVRVVMQNLSEKEYELIKGDKIGKLMFVHTQQDLNEGLFDSNPQQLNEHTQQDLKEELLDSASQHSKE